MIEEVYKMDGTEKFWLGIWCSSIIGIILFVGIIMVLNQIERQSYLDAGLQECKYVLVGNAGVATSWMKECPKGGLGAIVTNAENVK